MTAQTITRHDIHAIIDDLSDGTLEKLAPYVIFLSNEDYGDKPHIPNAETASAIREGRAGNTKSFHSIEALLADLKNDNDD